MTDAFAYVSAAGRSSLQEAHVQARLAQLAVQRKERQQSQDLSEHLPDTSSVGQFIRTGSSYSRETNTTSTTHSSLEWATHLIGKSNPDTAGRNHLVNRYSENSLTMDSQHTAAGAYSSSHAEHNHESLLKNPFEFRHGRRYLREVPYPLPCDLVELQRQNLRTLVSCKAFDRVICSPNVESDAPTKILEIGCGSGYWSMLCHDHLSRSRKTRDVEFTGLDVAPLAPNLNQSGINWRFVQHDIRRLPLPFDDGEFDFVMIKDISMAVPIGTPYQLFFDECVRILRGGGTIEVWESDHTIRSLQPHPPPAHTRNLQEREAAERTATYCLAHGTPFAATQNKYLRQANSWIAEALDRRKLSVTPCSRIGRLLTQEPGLCAVGSRRIAIPLSELSWERGNPRGSLGDPHDSPMSTGSRIKGRLVGQQLTDDQSALRRTALMTVVQMIEGMEPVLREISGKNSEEWGNWWTSMMANLTDPSRGALTGESLEVGAWWATKQYNGL